MPTEKDTDRVSMVAPHRAWELIQAEPNALLLDVRSDMEFLMIGHPVGAVNIPWIDGPDWVVNPKFVVQVRRLLLGRVSGRARGRVPAFLICRSGNRSLDAARELGEHDLADVHVIEGGFEGPLDDEHHRSTVAGWRKEGLPWEQC